MFITGSVDVKQLKQNDTAELGCKLYLTKPLGVGILSTAQKKGILRDEDAHRAPESMTQLNTIGKELAKIEGVKAMTDVTGFGLLGHLTEMCDGSDLSATVDFAKVPKIDNLDWYLEQRSIPGGTTRNWDSYGHGISLSDEAQKNLLCDPQTSGGLLIAVSPDSQKEVEQLLEENEMNSISFGQLIPKGEYLITVN